ncbi:MAG: sigma-70 family RNA polymerase sigma factor [Pyrinomonadaceae bacterium]|nr:sigma-70 family RNA polymerase sigma factor [Phycisphaerales bacterium]
MTPEASDLFAARQGGEAGAAAFARLYDRHAPVVRALCRRHVPVGRGGEAEADDALQETFIRAFQMLDRIEDPDRVRSWLYAIARRVCAERRRAAARRVRHERGGATVILNASMEYTPAPGRDGAGGNSSGGVGQAKDGTPGACAEHAEQLAMLDAALDKLPDSERLAIHLYYLDPDPVLAASECLGLSRSGFYKLLTRAKERLASLMSHVPT